MTCRQQYLPGSTSSTLNATLVASAFHDHWWHQENKPAFLKTKERTMYKLRQGKKKKQVSKLVSNYYFPSSFYFTIFVCVENVRITGCGIRLHERCSSATGVNARARLLSLPLWWIEYGQRTYRHGTSIEGTMIAQLTEGNRYWSIGFDSQQSEECTSKAAVNWWRLLDMI